MKHRCMRGVLCVWALVESECYLVLGFSLRFAFLLFIIVFNLELCQIFYVKFLMVLFSYGFSARFEYFLYVLLNILSWKCVRLWDCCICVLFFIYLYVCLLFFAIRSVMNRWICFVLYKFDFSFLW